MSASVHARRLFIPAAIFNFFAGGAILFALPFLAGPMKTQLSPSALPFIHMTTGAVLLFGWGVCDPVPALSPRPSGERDGALNLPDLAAQQRCARPSARFEV